jgi:hypothetical protein
LVEGTNVCSRKIQHCSYTSSDGTVWKFLITAFSYKNSCSFWYLFPTACRKFWAVHQSVLIPRMRALVKHHVCLPTNNFFDSKLCLNWSQYCTHTAVCLVRDEYFLHTQQTIGFSGILSTSSQRNDWPQ